MKKSPGTKQILSEMNMAAQEAAETFEHLDPNARETMRQWWDQWFGTVGHKRLGRILLGTHPDRSTSKR